MAKINSCKIDEVLVTDITFHCISDNLVAEVAFAAQRKGAGVLTIEGLNANDQIAEAAAHLKGVIEAHIATLYGDVETADATPVVGDI